MYVSGPVQICLAQISFKIHKLNISPNENLPPHIALNEELLLAHERLVHFFHVGAERICSPSFHRFFSFDTHLGADGHPGDVWNLWGANPE